jgi:hypothetical protein
MWSESRKQGSICLYWVANEGNVYGWPGCKSQPQHHGKMVVIRSELSFKNGVRIWQSPSKSAAVGVNLGGIAMVVGIEHREAKADEHKDTGTSVR